MAWESPLDPPGTWKAGFIDVCEWIYLYVFTAELLCKVLAYGFAMHDGSYMRDAWCQVREEEELACWLPMEEDSSHLRFESKRPVDSTRMTV